MIVLQLKFRSLGANINFNVSDYRDDLKQVKSFMLSTLTKLGLFLLLRAYNKAAIKCNGREAITDFELSTYEGELSTDVDNGGSMFRLSRILGIH
ncbi:hypothetical protein RND71_016124 [Anisodus tanguticus]|uniref:Uncharacterized protein n=1 Tax=Anisodus tanguticus TaxID=243964 RepID=A0AAE1VIB5_9SOLA|nr:hypothetical protein RND71_016124 [Anisodus tanguticus]